MGAGPDKVIILSDGIRGHMHQSKGVAFWLTRLTGGSFFIYEVPKRTGWLRLRDLKIGARSLPAKNGPELESWLLRAGGDSLLDEVRASLGDTPPGEVLFLTTGSSSAPFSFALARLTGAHCATIMTPSVLGTEPFDYAIVPEHDHPEQNPNLFVSLGAPNHIVPESLHENAMELEERYPHASEKRWALLLGGDDANYRISPSWVMTWVSPLLELAQREGADLYITTSRRTSAEAEKKLVELCGDCDHVRMLLLASEDSSNPVPGMLGLCQKVLCTDDSVSMVSEAITAGTAVALLRTERKSGLRPLGNAFCERLVRSGRLDRKHLSGPARFDQFFAHLVEKDYLFEPGNFTELELFLRNGLNKNDRPVFGEARRAAEWLIERWND